jgi:DNA-binding IclR family transcriptional regulator
MKRSERRPVSKALHALHWFVESSRPHIGVRQLAAAMDIAPSSAHRILAALSEAGLVRRDTRSQRYGLTPEFFRLSHLAVAMSPLRQAGLAAMQRLTDTCHESALLCLYDDDLQEMMFVAGVDGSRAANRSIRMNEWLPIRTGASGLAILAFLEEDERQAVIARSGLCSPSAPAHVEPERLDLDLADVRRQGYAFTPCQMVSGAVGMAAPIFNGRGEVVGDVCVTLPAQRIGDDGQGQLADAVRRCAGDITARMSGVEAETTLA